MTVKEGDKVRHKKTRRIAYVAEVYEDIEGGVRLDREISGFYSWNVENLALIDPKEKTRLEGEK